MDSNTERVREATWKIFLVEIGHRRKVSGVIESFAAVPKLLFEVLA